ncbi:MAG: nitroreductase [Nitrosopumilus sp.]|jgi:nitroreductase|nr:nitroreductase [Nitrosopumilus sp.]MBT3574209.1 nitroreductase [Nitrosopumilus sp.]MBT4535950.1 nitroreductase [Nitrosopumilus sp.]MBT6083637.1 nitroreductase [Nitrosopumilus sp.]MBT6195409.1 nitroreductase [Nitrosopumilus sp.]
MSFYDVVKNRRSVRTFTNKKISESKINKILKCASMAPSALGFQSYKIFVIKNKFMKEKLIKATHDQTYVDTDTVLVFCVEPKKIRNTMGPKGEHLFALQDATIAAAYAQMAVTAEGLHSIWIGHLNEKMVKEIIKTKLRPVCILPIGYSTEKPQHKDEKKLSVIVSKRK